MSSLGQQLSSIATRYRSPLDRVASIANQGFRRAGGPPRYGWVGRFAAPGGGTSNSLCRRSRLEAVLLLSREPLSLRKLSQLANLADGTEARTQLAALRRRYDERGCAFQVERVAGGYQLLTRPGFASWLRPLRGVDQE
ncbi:MAG: SMC-Scp complex subunit ScpB, partial [Planctomycetes bacterium]|nr:SMC-Scp complex subunit ScpB [Planctomycetota bacterium]